MADGESTVRQRLQEELYDEDGEGEDRIEEQNVTDLQQKLIDAVEEIGNLNVVRPFADESSAAGITVDRGTRQPVSFFASKGDPRSASIQLYLGTTDAPDARLLSTVSGVNVLDHSDVVDAVKSLLRERQDEDVEIDEQDRRYSEETRALRGAVNAVSGTSVQSTATGRYGPTINFRHEGLGTMQVSFSKDPSGRSMDKSIDVVVERVDLFEPVVEETFTESMDPAAMESMAADLIRRAIEQNQDVAEGFEIDEQNEPFASFAEGEELADMISAKVVGQFPVREDDRQVDPEEDHVGVTFISNFTGDVEIGVDLVRREHNNDWFVSVEDLKRDRTSTQLQRSFTARGMKRVRGEFQEFLFDNTESLRRLLEDPEEVDEQASNETAECPECGTDVLVATCYCTNCEEKVDLDVEEQFGPGSNNFKSAVINILIDDHGLSRREAVDLVDSRNARPILRDAFEKSDSDSMEAEEEAARRLVKELGESSVSIGEQLSQNTSDEIRSMMRNGASPSEVVRELGLANRVTPRDIERELANLAPGSEAEFADFLDRVADELQMLESIDEQLSGDYDPSELPEGNAKMDVESAQRDLENNGRSLEEFLRDMETASDARELENKYDPLVVDKMTNSFLCPGGQYSQEWEGGAKHLIVRDCELEAHDYDERDEASQFLSRLFWSRSLPEELGRSRVDWIWNLHTGQLTADQKRGMEKLAQSLLDGGVDEAVEEDGSTLERIKGETNPHRLVEESLEDKVDEQTPERAEKIADIDDAVLQVLRSREDAMNVGRPGTQGAGKGSTRSFAFEVDTSDGPRPARIRMSDRNGPVRITVLFVDNRGVPIEDSETVFDVSGPGEVRSAVDQGISELKRVVPRVTFEGREVDEQQQRFSLIEVALDLAERMRRGGWQVEDPTRDRGDAASFTMTTDQRGDDASRWDVTLVEMNPSTIQVDVTTDVPERDRVKTFDGIEDTQDAVGTIGDWIVETMFEGDGSERSDAGTVESLQSAGSIDELVDRKVSEQNGADVDGFAEDLRSELEGIGTVSGFDAGDGSISMEVEDEDTGEVVEVQVTVGPMDDLDLDEGEALVTVDGPGDQYEETVDVGSREFDPTSIYDKVLDVLS